MQELPGNRFKMAAPMIYQVYFNEETKKACDPAFEHYDNSSKLNEFFENQIIADLIEKGEHLQDEYFGVFSHHVKEKIPLKGIDHLHFSPESLERSIENYKVDVFGFCKRREATNIVLQGDRWHPKFTLIMYQVLDHCGITLPAKLDKIILFNLMVCRGHFWTAYYNDLLKPAMEILKEIPEAYEDSRYSLLGKPLAMDPVKTVRFKKAFGLEYYPYHPFICERLASIYLQLNKQFTFKQIF